jgi:hypothetical protein
MTYSIEQGLLVHLLALVVKAGCEHKKQPNADWCELDEGQTMRCEFMLSCSATQRRLIFVEETRSIVDKKGSLGQIARADRPRTA